MELAVSLFTALANTLLGLFTFYKNPKSATSRLLVGVAVSIGLWAIFNYFSLNASNEILTLFWIRAVMVVTSFLGPFALALSLVFPEDKITFSKYLQIFLIIISFASATLAMTPLMFSGVTITDGNISPTPQPGIIVFAISFLGGLLASIIVIIYKLIKSRGIRRQQMKYVVLGMATTFILMGITNFLLVVLFNISTFVVFGPSFSLILVGSFSYAIIRHRLLEIKFLVVRAVGYALVSTLVIALFASGLFSLTVLVPPQFSLIATTALALVLAYLFDPLQKLIARMTNFIFRKSIYSQADLLEALSEIVRSTLSINSLTKQVFKALKSTIQPTKAAFILLKEDGISIKNFDFEPIPDIDEKTVKRLARKAKNSLLVYEEVEKPKLRNKLSKLDFSVVVPLQVSKQIHGIFVLGPKASGEIYSNQDLNVLEIFGPQMSIAIQNSLAYDEIKQFNVTLREEVKKATSDLRKANKHLRHLDKLKDEFVYIATHELKTPVTVMKGYLSMIQGENYGEVPKPMHEPLHEITMANQQLILLVNDLLDIARSEAGQLTVKTEPVNMQSIVAEVVKSVSTLAEDKELKLKYNETDEVWVMGDEDRLREICNNLVSNAIKYSTKGTIEISHTDDKDVVVTHIKDQGHGISDDDQKHLFSRFFRAEDTANTAPGTGLGLFIVKQLVEKMGGRIWFTSKLGKGTTFSFSMKKPEK